MVDLTDVILSIAIVFALWGMVRNYAMPDLNKALQLEINRLTDERDKLIVIGQLASIEVERERHIRRLVEEYHHKCRSNMIANGVVVSDYEEPAVYYVSRHNRNVMVDVLTVYFSMDELESLTYKLGVLFDMVSHNTVQVAATQLAWYMERRGRFQDLVDVVNELRPNINLLNKLNT